MFKGKFLIVSLLIFLLTGCGGEKVSTDEDYFNQTNEIISELKPAVAVLMGAIEIYTDDHSRYAEMGEPGQKAYDIFTKEYEALTNITAVAGWESRHNELTDDVKYFQDFAREVVRTSKSGDPIDLGSPASNFPSRYTSVNSLTELYQAKK
ncbi:hypothetical protein MHB43_23735 [Paenibacillus sp. FSL H8-0317]|uniref:hypothetical protein n=1 Tax=Paenibacillus sp. FSL H8-0317 TaxID=2921385 RepID=UPI00324B987F